MPVAGSRWVGDVDSRRGVRNVRRLLSAMRLVLKVSYVDLDRLGMDEV